MAPKSKSSNLLARVRKIALSFPDTEESSRLGGSPHFYVRDKIFAGCGDEGGTWSVGVKVGLDLQSILVEREGIEVAKYVGRYGWISVAEEALQDEAELEHLIGLSHDLIRSKAQRGRKAGGKQKAAKKKAAKK